MTRAEACPAVGGRQRARRAQMSCTPRCFLRRERREEASAESSQERLTGECLCRAPLQGPLQSASTECLYRGPSTECLCRGPLQSASAEGPPQRTAGDASQERFRKTSPHLRNSPQSRGGSSYVCSVGPGAVRVLIRNSFGPSPKARPHPLRHRRRARHSPPLRLCRHRQARRRPSGGDQGARDPPPGQPPDQMRRPARRPRCHHHLGQRRVPRPRARSPVCA